MNGIVIYLDNTGSARHYAAWLAKTTGFDLINLALQPHFDLSAYEYFILGSGLEHNRLQIADWLEKHWLELFDRDILLYFSSRQELSKDKKQELLQANLPAHIARSIRSFSLPPHYVLDASLSMMDQALQQISHHLKEKNLEREASTQKALFPLLKLVQKQVRRQSAVEQENSIPI